MVAALLQARAAGGRLQGSLQFSSACTPGSTLLCFIGLRGTSTVSGISDGTNTWAVETDGVNPIQQVFTPDSYYTTLWRAANTASSAVTVDPAYGGGADFDTIVISEWTDLDAVVDWQGAESTGNVSIAVGNAPEDDCIGMTFARAAYVADFALASGHTIAVDLDSNPGGGILAAHHAYRERDSGVAFTAEATTTGADTNWFGFGVLYSSAGGAPPPAAAVMFPRPTRSTQRLA